MAPRAASPGRRGSSTSEDADHLTLRRAFEAEGLTFLGVVCVADALQRADPARQQYRTWLEEGRQATMSYLERHERGKYDPSLALPGTQSVIVAGLGYHQQRPSLPQGSGLVARYAWGRDYHKVLVKKLQNITKDLGLKWPHEQWRCFTDTAPLDERWWAAQSGGTFTARNTLSIAHSLGSWFLLGEILTTLPLPATPARHQGVCPSGCRRCTDVCPTGALDASGRIDAGKCISYLTIEHRGPIVDELKAGVGEWLFGCDLCQEVCPFNLKVAPTNEPEFLAWKAGPHLDLEGILELNDTSFTARFGGSPVHRAGRAGLVRNACLVAANTRQYAFLERLRSLCDDEDAGVSDAARWAVAQLSAEVNP